MKNLFKRIRAFWTEQKTGIILFVGSLLSVSYCVFQIFVSISNGWEGMESFQKIVENTSVFIPVAAVFVTFLGGIFDMSIWFSDVARKSMKDTIERQRQTEAINPLVNRVATLFIEERGIEALKGKSDDLQLEEIKNFGADISIDIAAEQVGKDVFEFVKSVGGNIYENRIACKISDMLVQDDFANQVIKNIKSHMQIDVKRD
ncbi:hypothetical protein F4X73_11890 [Candidatus Poribacteria bacterium]|nr:hypothetical protein [Candidatus Poribacteria bacterium]